jgi:hypothetical protein
MLGLSLRPCAAAAAAASRRLLSAAPSGGRGNSSSDRSHTHQQETFFGFSPRSPEATTHFGFQTVAQELKDGLVAEVLMQWSVWHCATF